MLLRTVGKCVSKKIKEMNKNTKEVMFVNEYIGSKLGLQEKNLSNPI